MMDAAECSARDRLRRNYRWEFRTQSGSRLDSVAVARVGPLGSVYSCEIIAHQTYFFAIQEFASLLGMSSLKY